MLQSNLHSITNAIEMVDVLLENSNWVTEKKAELKGMFDLDKVSFKLLIRENTYKQQYNEEEQKRIEEALQTGSDISIISIGSHHTNMIKISIKVVK